VEFFGLQVERLRHKARITSLHVSVENRTMI